jgi:pyridoxine/pyridoxamine 5'-phosphate oxidase
MDASEVYLAKPAPEAIQEHLSRPINAVVGTHNPDGSIHLAFVLFLWEEGRFYFETASMTRKARNVAERPTASFAIEGKGFMAMAEGTVRSIVGDEAHAINGRLRKKYLTDEAVDAVGGAWASVDDVAIEITPTRWRSWSNEALRELSREAAGDLPPSDWWVSEDA